MTGSERATGRRALLLDALEAQMLHKRLSEVNVEDVAVEAGITRTRFYHYFESKYDALAAALEGISDELVDAYLTPQSWFAGAGSARPRESLHFAFTSVHEVWGKHAAVLREAQELWNAAQQVRLAYDALFGRLAALTAKRIDAERSAGRAPDGPPSYDLARGLLWGGERVLTLWIIESKHGLTVEGMFDTELALWMRTIYLDDDPSLDNPR